MGWGSAYRIFDAVCSAVLDKDGISKEEIIMIVAEALEDADWDTQQDSDYWEHPVVQKVMRKLHPSWFEDE